MNIKKSKIFLIIAWVTLAFNVMQCLAMQIYLKTLSGKTITIDVEGSDAIWQVKEKIARKHTEYPADVQRIISFGKELDNRKTLAELDVQAQTVVHLITRLGCSSSNDRPKINLAISVMEESTDPGQAPTKIVGEFGMNVNADSTFEQAQNSARMELQNLLSLFHELKDKTVNNYILAIRNNDGLRLFAYQRPNKINTPIQSIRDSFIPHDSMFCLLTQDCFNKETSEHISKSESGPFEEKIMQLSATLTDLKNRLSFLKTSIQSIKDTLNGKAGPKAPVRVDQIALITTNLVDIKNNSVITTDQSSVVLSDIIVNCNTYKEDETLKQLIKDTALQVLQKNQVLINQNQPDTKQYLDTFLEFLKSLHACGILTSDELTSKKKSGNINKTYNQFIDNACTH